MSIARRPGQPTARRRGIRIAFGSLGALLIFALLIFFAGRAWIEAYLRSEKFRRFVSQKTSETLLAEGEFAPFSVTGTNFYSNEFTAIGTRRSFFSGLRIDQIRAEVSGRRFFEKVWQIDQVTAQRVEVKIGGTRIEAPAGRTTIRQDGRSQRRAGWLPNRVEIGSASVLDTNISWGDRTENAGAIRAVALDVRPRNGGWDFSARGGRLEQRNFPVLDVKALEIHYRAPAIVVQSAELGDGGSGIVNVTGEVRGGESLDLRAVLSGISVTPLLPEDWRVRLHGNLAGEVRVHAALPAQGPPTLTGSLNLSQGQLEALPVLDQIALFTRTQQFRRLALSKVSADFRNENGQTDVKNFVAESEGLIRVEGSFVIVGGTIEGAFQVGVTPASLQWLPGSQDRVFTEQRQGYVWTRMRLSGPLAKPGEDLSPRLITAAQGALRQGVENTVRETIKTGKDAAKGALDFLMPLFK